MFLSSLLRKKYPLETSIKKRIQICIGFSLFISFFLLIFQPFGIAYGHRLTIFGVAFGSGFICFAVMFIFQVLVFYFFPKLFQAEKWTVGKEFFITLLNVSIIGFFNILYASWAGFIDFSVWGILKFEFYTISVATFPILISFSIKNYIESRRILNQNLKHQEVIELPQVETKTIHSTQNPLKNLSPYKTTEQIKEIEQVKATETLLETLPKTKKVAETKVKSKPFLVSIPTENKEEDFKILADDLLYIQAADNYLEIIFLENDIISKKLIRNTLKSISEILEQDFPQFFRCHKSYLINLHQVKHISGNAQGYKLHLFYGDELIPVSRKNNSIIKEKLEIFIKKQV